MVLEGRRGERVRSPLLIADTLSSGLERYLYIWVPEPPRDFNGNEPRGCLGGRAYRKIDGLDLARSEAKGVLIGQSLLYEVEAVHYLTFRRSEGYLHVELEIVSNIPVLCVRRMERLK